MPYKFGQVIIRRYAKGNWGHTGRPGLVGGSSAGGFGGGRGESEKGSKKGLKTKMTISQAANMLAKNGYILGRGKTNLDTMKTSYEVTMPDGKTKIMTAKEIETLVLRLK